MGIADTWEVGGAWSDALTPYSNWINPDFKTANLGLRLSYVPILQLELESFPCQSLPLTNPHSLICYHAKRKRTDS